MNRDHTALNPAPIAHLVNLGQVGGVESMMLSVARRLHPDRDHGGLTLTDHLHPQWKSQWPPQGLALCPLKRWGPVRLREKGWLHQQILRRRLQHNGQPAAALLWGLWPSEPVLKTLRVEGIRIIYMEHGSAWRSEPGGRLAKGLPWADQVITNSAAAKRVLELGWGLDRPTTVLLNPLRPEAAPSAPRAAPPRDQANPLRVGLVGRCEPFKGFELALHAARILQRKSVALCMEVAGDGPERPRLEQLAERLGLGQVVRFHGNVSDMASFYGGLDLLLCPSLREPFGLVSIEAQAWGVPVVVSGVDGLPETVHAGETGTVIRPSLTTQDLINCDVAAARLPRWVYDPSTDTLGEPKGVAPEAIAAAVRRYAEDETMRQTHGSAASQWAFQRFHMDNYVRQLSALLHTPATETR